MTNPRLRSLLLGLLACGFGLSSCSDGDWASPKTSSVAATTTSTTEPTSSSFDDVVSVIEEPSAFENWDQPPTTFDPAETIAADEQVRGPATTIPTGIGPRPVGYTGFLGNLGLDEIVAGAAAPPPVAAPGTAPLTGLAGAVPNRPAVIAKIDNSPAARPQRGLNAADIVFEEQVEGGVTRFAAVFHSQTAVVGPIRSTRTTDISFINAFGGPALLYSGANKIVDAILMRQETIQNYSAARSSGYWRDSSRRIPHNLFTDSASFIHRGSSPPATFAYRQPRTGSQTAQTTTTDGPTTSFTSTSSTSRSSVSTTQSTSASQVNTSQPTSQPATSQSTAAPTTSVPTTVARPPSPSRAASVLSATLGQTRVRWDWSGSSWLRTQNGSVHKTDGGAQVSAANVVVAVVTEAATGMTDSVRTPVPEFVFVGSGQASVFSEGRRIDGTWTRPTLRSAAVLTDVNGTVIELTPGRTWVELVTVGTYQSS